MTQLENGVIKDSWALLAFAKTHGKMEVADFDNKDTGDTFKACKFTNGSKVVLVSFGRRLQEDNGNKPLTPQQIAAQKNDLEICEWETNDGRTGYTMYKPGDPKKIGRNAEAVDLGL